MDYYTNATPVEPPNGCAENQGGYGSAGLECCGGNEPASKGMAQDSPVGADECNQETGIDRDLPQVSFPAAARTVCPLVVAHKFDNLCGRWTHRVGVVLSS